jgi:hypothetical protein
MYRSLAGIPRAPFLKVGVKGSDHLEFSDLTNSCTSMREEIIPMRKRIGTILLAGGAAALAIGLGTTSSFATTATTWTVKPGGSFTGKSGTTTLTDTKTGAVLTCTSSSTAGTLKKGSGLANPIGHVTKVAFTGCTGPAGLTFTVTTTASTTNPWPVTATSYSSTTGTTKGTISHIHAVLKGTNSSCTATVDGTGATAKNGKVVISHKNSAANKLSVLKGGDNLHAYKVSGCLGALNSGDPTTFVATYTLSAGQKITSP